MLFWSLKTQTRIENFCLYNLLTNDHDVLLPAFFTAFHSQGSVGIRDSILSITSHINFTLKILRLIENNNQEKNFSLISADSFNTFIIRVILTRGVFISTSPAQQSELSITEHFLRLNGSRWISQCTDKKKKGCYYATRGTGGVKCGIWTTIEGLSEMK